MKQKPRTEICPYANGINDREGYGHCCLTTTRCFDIFSYKGCFFYEKKKVEEKDTRKK